VREGEEGGLSGKKIWKRGFFVGDCRRHFSEGRGEGNSSKFDKKTDEYLKA